MNAMKSLKLKNRFQSNTTTIENDFIDHHMAKANGEYVKVYLLLLRHLHDDCSPLTISRLADYLDCTEKDIVRALNYWSNEGLLQIYYDETGNINGLAIGKSFDNHAVEKVPAEEAVAAKFHCQDGSWRGGRNGIPAEFGSYAGESAW